jgi:ring-1,2-phenylacetyl-CoA epoxidase subunit PaaC
MTASSHATTAHIDYLLHLADNAVVLGQRNGEWCGHGPVLEEDIAMTNMSLDLIGQARMLYQHAATLIGNGATEDSLAYFVGYASDNRDYAVTIVRNFLYSSLMLLVWERLQNSSDTQLAAIAAKSLKEVRYHVRHAGDWLVRFGDGTTESHQKAQAALEHLMPYTQEFWSVSDFESDVAASGIGVEVASLREAWEAQLQETLHAATLQMPSTTGFITTGKHQVHSEHLTYLLDEMQSLARRHPEGVW